MTGEALLNNNSEKQQERCGFVALLGAPNAGKSTFLNKAVGARVSIVTPKAQTTRMRARGIVNEGRTQIVFCDTPGLFKPKRKLDEAMVGAAWDGLKDADLALLVVDATRAKKDDIKNISIESGAKAQKSKIPLWLVLNKIDDIKRELLLPLAEEVMQQSQASEVFMVSALTGDGVRDLMCKLADILPVGPFMFPEDMLTDMPERTWVSELIREQVFFQTHDELPYDSTVEIQSFKNRPDGSVRIDANIYVMRSAQKAIVIGERGKRIREIGKKARSAIEYSLGQTCHLFLQVKEKPKWDQDIRRLKEIRPTF
ncbi:GTPase Era [Acetobacteraceae bacterium]|nr:GTPase Era [Acetobacteraceae bacterium]